MSDVEFVESGDETKNRLDQIETALARMADNFSKMPEMIANAVAKSQPAPTEPEEKVVEKEPVDLEGMSRKDFSLHLMDMFKRELVEPLSKKFQNVEYNQEVGGRRQEFVNFAMSNPEMGLYMEEVKEVLKRNPELSPADTLKLARASASEERRREVDGKIREEEGDKQVGEEAEEEAPVVSFFPTAATKESKEGRMNAEDAAEDAWSQTFGSIREIGS